MILLVAALVRPVHADLIPAPPPSAHQLAREAAAACGDLGALAELSFTFVVEKGGEEVARRQHLWRPEAGTVDVSLGSGPPVQLRIEARMPDGEADPRWASLAPGVPPAQALNAWSAFVNDQYWLLAPCKATDPGVKPAIENGQLVLSFDGVGLTPGDRYTLMLHPETGALRFWSFTLQSGATGEFLWSEPVDVGPLHLLLRRSSPQGDTVIHFEAVSGRAR